MTPMPWPDGSEVVLLAFEDRRPLEALREKLEENQIVATEELQSLNLELEVTHDELRHRVADLEAAERADVRKNRFLTMLAHELRNPLGPVLNALHIVRQHLGGDRVVAHAVEIAHRQVTYQARLLDDLLDVSRIVLDKVELRREAVDLAAIVKETLEALGPTMQSRAHRLSVALPEAALLVEGDPTRFVQIVRNLVHNAVKYTPAGGHIWVTLGAESETAVLSVRDDGLGIGTEVLPHIFDLFTQGDSPSVRAQGGLGIGLTLVRRLVELHGGTVTAFSAGPNRGSEFVVRLPVGTSTAPNRAAVTPKPSARRILIVEDEPDARELLRMVLEMEGHRVDVASDGSSGVSLAAQLAPDVVLVDIGLPGLDGYAVARRIRKKLGSAVRLIALTGYGDSESRARATEAGFDVHLVKPVGPEHIAAALGSA